MPNPHHSGFVIYSWHCLSCLVRLRPTPKRSVTKPVVMQTSPVDGNRVAISLKKTVCRNADARELQVRATSYQGWRFDDLHPGLSIHSPCVGMAGLHTLHSPPLSSLYVLPHIIQHKLPNVYQNLCLSPNQRGGRYISRKVSRSGTIAKFCLSGLTTVNNLPFPRKRVFFTHNLSVCLQ